MLRSVAGRHRFRLGVMRAAAGIAAVVVFAVMNPCSAPAASTDRPNIVLMMADDLGWGDVGFNGNTTVRTPHLDAMAAKGLKFTRFYAAAPVCSPTRGSCLTGRHPYRYGIFSANVGHIRPEEHTLAERLRAERGYATGHFGKWHLGTLTKTVRDSNRGGRPRGREHYAPPGLHGFDVSFSTEAKVPTWNPLWRPKDVRRNTWWDPVDARDGQPYGTAYWSNGEPVTDGLHGDDSQIIMDHALPFIREAVANEKPFLAVIWFHAPHLPVVAGPKYTAMYAEHDKYTQHYYGCITALDEQVGRLRRELRTLGVAENTLVWFCSDNGPEGNNTAPGSTGGLRGRKRSLFEGGIRVPGVLEWPGRIPSSRVTAVPACTSDYLPTIADLLNLDVPDDRPIDGASLMPLIEGRTKDRPRPIAFESRGQLALVGNRYKAVFIPPGRRRKRDDLTDESLDPTKFLLFDLTTDRGEERNLADKHPDVVQRMVRNLEEWRESCRRSLAEYDEVERSGPGKAQNP